MKLAYLKIVGPKGTPYEGCGVSGIGKKRSDAVRKAKAQMRKTFGAGLKTEIVAVLDVEPGR